MREGTAASAATTETVAPIAYATPLLIARITSWTSSGAMVFRVVVMIIFLMRLIVE